MRLHPFLWENRENKCVLAVGIRINSARKEGDVRILWYGTNFVYDADFFLLSASNETINQICGIHKMKRFLEDEITLQGPLL